MGETKERFLNNISHRITESLFSVQQAEKVFDFFCTVPVLQ